MPSHMSLKGLGANESIQWWLQLQSQDICRYQVGQLAKQCGNEQSLPDMGQALHFHVLIKDLWATLGKGEGLVSNSIVPVKGVHCSHVPIQLWKQCAHQWGTHFLCAAASMQQVFLVCLALSLPCFGTQPSQLGLRKQMVEWLFLTVPYSVNVIVVLCSQAQLMFMSLWSCLCFSSHIDGHAETQTKSILGKMRVAAKFSLPVLHCLCKLDWKVGRLPSKCYFLTSSFLYPQLILTSWLLGVGDDSSAFFSELSSTKGVVPIRRQLIDALKVWCRRFDNFWNAASPENVHSPCKPCLLAKYICCSL